MTFSSLAADTFKSAQLFKRLQECFNTTNLEAVKNSPMSYIKRGLMEEMSTFVAMEAAQQRDSHRQ